MQIETVKRRPWGAGRAEWAEGQRLGYAWRPNSTQQREAWKGAGQLLAAGGVELLQAILGAEVGGAGDGMRRDPEERIYLQPRQQQEHSLSAFL